MISNYEILIYTLERARQVKEITHASRSVAAAVSTAVQRRGEAQRRNSRYRKYGIPS